MIDIKGKIKEQKAKASIGKNMGTTYADCLVEKYEHAFARGIGIIRDIVFFVVFLLAGYLICAICNLGWLGILFIVFWFLHFINKVKAGKFLFG